MSVFSLLFFHLCLCACLTNGLRCKVGRAYHTSNSIVKDFLPSGRLKSQTCGVGEICHIFDAKVSFEYSPSKLVQVRIGECVHVSACPLHTCESDKSSIVSGLLPGHHISSCCAACCSTHNCNRASAKSIDPACLARAPPTSSFAPVVATSSLPDLSMQAEPIDTSGRVYCQVGQEFNYSSHIPRSAALPSIQFTSKQCERDEVCYMLEANVTSFKQPSSIVNVRIGQCTPRAKCSSLDCASLSSAASSGKSSLFGGGDKLSSCCAGCCSTHNCNRASARSIDPACLARAPPTSSFAPVVATSPLPELSTVSEPIDTFGRVYCQVGQEFNYSSNIPRSAALPSIQFTSEQCERDEVCCMLEAVVTSFKQPSSIVNVRIGHCTPRDKCSSIDCASLSLAASSGKSSLFGGGDKLKSCCSACCLSNNCNGVGAASLSPGQCINDSNSKQPSAVDSKTITTTTRSPKNKSRVSNRHKARINLLTSTEGPSTSAVGNVSSIASLMIFLALGSIVCSIIVS